MLGKLFDRQPASGAASGNTGPRIPRHSGGWGTLRKRLAGEEGLRDMKYIHEIYGAAGVKL